MEKLRDIQLDEIERGMYVLIKYNDSWWDAKVTGVSKKTGLLTCWIGDYAKFSVHYSKVKVES